MILLAEYQEDHFARKKSRSHNNKTFQTETLWRIILTCSNHRKLSNETAAKSSIIYISSSVLVQLYELV